MGPPPPVARVPGARRPRDPVPLDVYGIVRGAHPAASASIARSRRVSGVEREGFQGFLSRAREEFIPPLTFPSSLSPCAGIKKPKKHAKRSTKGMDTKFLLNQRYCKKGSKLAAAKAAKA